MSADANDERRELSESDELYLLADAVTAFESTLGRLVNDLDELTGALLDDRVRFDDGTRLDDANLEGLAELLVSQGERYRRVRHTIDSLQAFVDEISHDRPDDDQS